MLAMIQFGKYISYTAALHFQCTMTTCQIMMDQGLLMKLVLRSSIFLWIGRALYTRLICKSRRKSIFKVVGMFF